MERALRLGSRMYVARRGAGTESLDEVSEAEFRRSVRAYVAAHPGKLPTSAADVEKYLTSTYLPTALATFRAKPAAEFRPEELRKLLPPR
jgi:hypothetical protein